MAAVNSSRIIIIGIEHARQSVERLNSPKFRRAGALCSEVFDAFIWPLYIASGLEEASVIVIAVTRLDSPV